MNTFVLHLQDSRQYERITGVESFVGEDASGQFGIQAGHERLIAALEPGLMRYRIAGQDWTWLALPGGIAYFAHNELSLSTRRYFRDTDYRRISAVLQGELLAEERALDDIRGSLRRMEEEMLRRLWRMGREAAGS